MNSVLFFCRANQPSSMPSSCSIPGCRTNCRENERALSVFKFPDDTVRRTQWEWAVQQLYDPTFVVQKGQKICIRHFEEKFIEKEHKAYRDDGTLLILPRKSVSLSDAAIPTLFDFLPDPVPSTCIRRKPVIQIASLGVLRNLIDLRLHKDFEGWTVAYCEVRRALSAYKVHITEALEPQIRFSVTINSRLIPHIVHPVVSDADLPSLFSDSSPVVVNEWKKFIKIIRFLEVKSTLVKSTPSVANSKRKRYSNDEDEDRPVYGDDEWEMVVIEVDSDGIIQTTRNSDGSDSPE
ncbi:Hypothetical protein NTJ_09510 [Nesidiocoris tenuis]|uniref:THAP-type domain-containing protein n=1 Tax=Nesidiocoris tenuis TaxID=355587 RepID=A0ABN7B1T4_9HEMI|nr:Hypothetical protein NTJ_09510 [Nesidiocoris tenuis]